MVITDSEKDLVRKLNRWNDGLVKKSMKVNISKSKIMCGGRVIMMQTGLLEGHALSVVKGWTVTRYDAL